MLSAALFLLAVAAPAPSSPTQSSRAASADALYGEWVSDCVPMGQNGRHGLVVRLTISPGRFEANGQMYARNTCDVPVIASTYAARLQRVRGGPEQVRLELASQSATMTIHAEDVAALYDKGGNCGLKGWRRGVPMHVEGRICDPLSFPAAGANIVQSAQISGDRLMLSQLQFLVRGADVPPGVILPADLKFQRKGK